MMANIIRVLPVQVAEFLQARAQLPHLLPAAWLVAALSMEEDKTAVHSSLFNSALM